MTAADRITAARALIEPLTDFTPGPWEIDAPKDESVEIGAGCVSIAGLYEAAPDALPDARLIAAAPALRDTVAALADLADAQAQEIARLKATIRALDLVLERSGYAPSSLAREAIRAALGDAP